VLSRRKTRLKEEEYLEMATQALTGAGKEISPEAFIANIAGVFALALSDKMDAAVTAATGMSTSACYAIVTIGTEPGNSIETLRRMLSLEHSSLVRLIDRLEHVGLLRRTRGMPGDRRQVLIDLTDEGQACFQRILEARNRVVMQAIAPLDDKDRAELRRLIDKMTPSIVMPGDDQHFVCRLCDPDLCPQDKCPVNCAFPEYYEPPASGEAKTRQFAPKAA
jgi:DNA-binding MarR family transcriptional regulator